MRELVITETAKEDLERIALFLKATYSDRVKTDFLEAFTKRLQLIEQMPFMNKNRWFAGVSSQNTPLVFIR